MAKPENERERIALEPCPFCGSEAIRCQNHEGRLPEAMIWIMCKACHASPGDFPTDERAVAAWNRRAPLPQQGEVAQRESGEPVAWLGTDADGIISVTTEVDTKDRFAQIGRTITPLYANHPASQAPAEPVAWLVTNGADTFVTMMLTDAETWGRNGATIVPLGPIAPPASQALAEPVAWTIADQEELAALIIRVVGLDDDPMRALQIKTPMARRAWDVSAQILGRTPSADPDACNYPACGCDVDEVCNAGIDKIEAAPAEAHARIEAEAELRGLQVDADLEIIDGVAALMSRGQLTQPRNVGLQIRKCVRQIRALLSGSTPQPATMVNDEPRDEAREDAWTDFERDHLTDGKGYAAADVYRRCRAAFDAAWPQGRKAAIAAATRSLATSINTPQPAGVEITEEAVERFRAWYLKHTGKRIFDKNARAALTAALSGGA